MWTRQTHVTVYFAIKNRSGIQNQNQPGLLTLFLGGQKWLLFGRGGGSIRTPPYYLGKFCTEFDSWGLKMFVGA